MNLQEFTAAVSVALSAATLPGCEKLGAVTAEGSNPFPEVSTQNIESPEMRKAVNDVDTEARVIFPKLFETYLREENLPGATLISTHGRTNEFVEHDRCFDDNSHLPSRLRPWNAVLPIDAQKVIEKIMLERGVRLERGGRVILPGSVDAFGVQRAMTRQKRASVAVLCLCTTLRGSPLHTER